MVNIKCVQKATSLLRKELGVGISKLSKEGLKDIKIPENAISYDAVKVGREANPTEYYTDVFIFRDKDGNVVSTVHNKIDNKKIKQTVRKYSAAKEEDLYIDAEEDIDFIPIKRQTVRGYEKEDGKITKCFEEHRAITDDKKRMETLKRDIYPDSNEVIKISHFENGSKPRFIENHYKKESLEDKFRSIPDFIRKQLIKSALKTPDKYAGYYILTDSKVSDEGLKELAQHQYFLPYFSPDKKFIHRMARQVEKEKESVNAHCYLKPYSKESTQRGYFGGNFGNNEIGINRLEPNGANRTRRSLANTIGHEFGHANWEQKVIEYDMAEEGLISLDKTNITKEQIAQIKKYKEADKNYVNPDKNIDEYIKNFTEIMARKEGRKTLCQYEELEELVNKHFPALDIYKKDPNVESDDISREIMELLGDFKFNDQLK